MVFLFKGAINNTNTPILQCHGTEDPVIYYKWGQLLAEALKEMNPKHEFKSYEGLKHGVNDQVRACSGVKRQPVETAIILNSGKPALVTR